MIVQEPLWEDDSFVWRWHCWGCSEWGVRQSRPSAQEGLAHHLLVSHKRGAGRGGAVQLEEVLRG